MREANICCNILWVIFGGFFDCVAWCLFGCILCISIIGIPAGVQCFKIGCFVLCPFGKQIVAKEGGYDGCDCILNFFWIIFAGLWLAILEVFCGIFLCITICGIPFGIQHFKIAKIAFMPFGSRILDEDAPPTVVATGQPPIVVVQTGAQPYPAQPYGAQPYPAQPGYAQPGYSPPPQPI